MTRHKHADAIIAWANGEEIEFRSGPLGKWKALQGFAPGFYSDYEYRVKPEVVVDYTAVSDSGALCASFWPSTEEAQGVYYSFHIGGFLKRTSLDGKIINFEFIPLNKE